MWADGLQPWLRPYAVALVKLGGSRVHVTSVFRSISKQRSLYRRAQRGRHAFPVAPPGLSKHNYGLAWDMVAEPRVLKQLGAIWTRWGGRWGGKRDPIHFEV